MPSDRRERSVDSVDWVIFWSVVVVLIPIGVLAQRKGWIDVLGSTERRGGTSVVGIGDEIFNPVRFEAQAELDRQTVLPAPAPIPGDGALPDTFTGLLRIGIGPAQPAREPRHRRQTAA